MGEASGVGRTQGPGHLSGADEANEASATPNEAKSDELLPEPTSLVNLHSMTSIILLMERSFTAQRKNAEERRDAAEASQERQEKRAVEDIRK